MAFKFRLKTVHHMTLEEYNAILAIQGGVCYICRKPAVRKRFAVDHDHKIAREECDHPPNESCSRCWRGLVHGYCNSLLATARDSIEFFERCIEYLKNPPAQRLFKMTIPVDTEGTTFPGNTDGITPKKES